MKRFLCIFALLLSFACVTSIPVEGFAKSAKTATEAVQKLSEKIDINAADVELLSTVPGIGPKTAEAIVAYRKANGTFSSLNDLVNIKGIGEKKLAKMKPYLKKI